MSSALASHLFQCLIPRASLGLFVIAGACGEAPSDTLEPDLPMADAAPSDAAPLDAGLSDAAPSDATSADTTTSEGAVDAAADARSQVPISVTPALGYLGSELDVVVTGEFSGRAPALDFGAGIEVLSMTAEDNRARVRIGIASDAAIAEHDLTITTQAGSVAVPRVFRVSPSLAVTTHGPLTQGSLMQVELESLDPATSLGLAPFSMGSDFAHVPGHQDGFGRTLVLIPPRVTPGPRQLEWRAVLHRGFTPLSAPGAIVIRPRDPELLPLGPSTMGPLAPFETRLYRVRVTESSVVTLGASGFARPVMWLFEAGGARPDQLRAAEPAPGGFGVEPRVELEFPAVAGEELLVVAHVQDPAGTSKDTALRLDVTPAPAIEQDDAVPHDRVDRAQAAAACTRACVLRGTLPPGGRQFYVLPSRPEGGFFLTALRSDGPGMAVNGGTDYPSFAFVRAFPERLSRLARFDDPFFFISSPYYLGVQNGGTATQSYAVSVRWFADPQPQPTPAPAAEHGSP